MTQRPTIFLSKSSIYALKATRELAKRGHHNFVTIRELSEELDISFYFLTKILQHLTRAGILESLKGPNGGVRFARSPQHITFMDIVEAVEGKPEEDSTEGIYEVCVLFDECPVRDKWLDLKKELKHLLSTSTIAEISGHQTADH